MMKFNTSFIQSDDLYDLDASDEDIGLGRNARDELKKITSAIYNSGYDIARIIQSVEKISSSRFRIGTSSIESYERVLPEGNIYLINYKKGFHAFAGIDLIPGMSKYDFKVFEKDFSEDKSKKVNDSKISKFIESENLENVRGLRLKGSSQELMLNVQINIVSPEIYSSEVGFWNQMYNMIKPNKTKIYLDKKFTL